MARCKYPGCTKRAISGIDPCYIHRCRHIVFWGMNAEFYSRDVQCRNCIVENNTKSCKGHLCAYPNCTRSVVLKRTGRGNRPYYYACEDHLCTIFGCDQPITPSSLFCYRHTCPAENCIVQTYPVLYKDKSYPFPCKQHKCSIFNCYEPADEHSRLCEDHLVLPPK